MNHNNKYIKEIKKKLGKMYRDIYGKFKQFDIDQNHN